MSKTIENLLQHSNLPGPRGNLELMYSFSKKASAREVEECLLYITDNLRNSPEEFVAMCGIVGFAVVNKKKLKETVTFLRKFASHGSWRIREAVAMGIQEMTGDRPEEMMQELSGWLSGNEFEKRAVVAALCEPKLLKDKTNVKNVLLILKEITLNSFPEEGKLTDGQTSLRKALGYGWSVVVVAFPDEGKRFFENLAGNSNRHIRWIIKENLKKNRLTLMDKKWVEGIEI
ncbi:MAG: hypothetical protein AB9834_17670 [Lentimicrobium sp.]